MARQHDDKSVSRATKLREEIDRLRRRGGKVPKDHSAPEPEGSVRLASPRKIIRERMRELDKKKDD